VNQVCLWHQDRLLEEEKTVGEYGLRAGSRLAAALSNELTGVTPVR